jgi:hypothetical protein
MLAGGDLTTSCCSGAQSRAAPGSSRMCGVCRKPSLPPKTSRWLRWCCTHPLLWGSAAPAARHLSRGQGGLAGWYQSPAIGAANQTCHPPPKALGSQCVKAVSSQSNLKPHPRTGHGGLTSQLQQAALL